MAKDIKDRTEDTKKEFPNVPYLNSSLFEPTEIERETLYISNLKDDRSIPVFGQTVLKDHHGKRRKGGFVTLDYLLEFLNAYDFSSEGSEEIQEDNKTLINASVLGLIFEKINGYKEGSFFTPGFITMYMARDILRQAVVQKFNDAKRWNCRSITDLYNKIKNVQEANILVNSIKICDPAVGSGHFLVSCLNEMIAIKSDLQILQDKAGRRLKNYHVEVVNDELIITDEEGDLFEYHPNQPESQRLQETIFHEKQTIIENCLFGVDINPNSTKICRLRLWIELLKNAYYIENASDATSSRPLQTLPNIDINIKTGNSLIRRFALDSDLKRALKKSKWNIDSYRAAVATYRNAKNKEEKREMEALILKIKQNFSSTIRLNNPLKKRLDRLIGELYYRFTGTYLFEPGVPYGNNPDDFETQREKEKIKLEKEIETLNDKLEEIKNNEIFNQSFEWRFEFPEVLDNEGNFVGFDVVIANPPYVDLKSLPSETVHHIFDNFQTAQNRINLYSTFIENSLELLKRNGFLSFIVPNSLLMNSSYQKLRDLIKSELFEIIKLPDNVFSEAIVETIILGLKKENEFDRIDALVYKSNAMITKINPALKFQINKSSWNIYEETKFNIYLSEAIEKILSKIHGKGKELGQVADFSLGITPYDKYKGHSKEIIKTRAFHSPVKLTDEYKPLISGGKILPFFVDNKVSEYIKYGAWLGAAREERFFTEPRVIVRQIVSGNPPRIFAGLTRESLYFTQIGFSIIPKSFIDTYELVALLNSNLINFYHRYLYLDVEKTLFQKVLIQNCKHFPCLPFPDKEKIKALVKSIILIKQSESGQDTSSLEAQINALVYNLYGLTEEEIKVVEQALK